jgi:tetratricopeptide (TPR) repeat protein
MHRNTFAFVIAAAIAGFIAGFWLANSINRNAPPSAASLPASNSVPAAQGSETELTDAEIREKIAEADRNPTNLSFQRDLGVSLYRYAAMKQDIGLLGDAARILERASTLDSKDFDVLVALGNAHFDVGFYKKDAASFQKSRDIYNKALAIKPGEPDVTTDLGLTYYLQEPPDNQKAATELEKVSAAKPNHDRSMQFLVRVYLRLDRVADAEKTLTKLKAVNPNNSAIKELDSLVAQQKGGAK